MNEENESQIKFPEIAEEILRRAKQDQEMREKGIANASEGEWFGFDEEVEVANTARMKEIVAEIGWPTISLVGTEASNGAWLLVQHADKDVDFQDSCLQRMKNLSEGEVKPENIAYLEDRVRVAKGMTQIYGTQFYTDENRRFGPRPIEDPEHINEIRAKVGLGSLKEYEEGLKNMIQRKV